MHIVAGLPPADRQSTAEIANEDAYQRVVHNVVRDGAVPGIVCAEHDLLPEQTEKACGRDHVSATQARYEKGEQYAVAEHLLAILDEATVVEAFVTHALVQRPKLHGDITLSLCIQRRVQQKVGLDLLLNGLCRIVPDDIVSVYR